MADSIAVTIAGAPEADAEAVYDELLEHLTSCRRCWEWRAALWRTDRLCAAGAGMVDDYAAAVCAESAPAVANVQLSGRVGVGLVELEILDGNAEVERQALDMGQAGPEPALFPRAERGRVDADPAGDLLQRERQGVPLLRLEPDLPDSVPHGDAPHGGGG
jgi:hypothetical protein